MDPAMFINPKHMIRYLAVMTLVIVALGIFLRVETRCERSVVRSLNVRNIISCASLYETPPNGAALTRH
jgi:hypothetical protein